MNVHLQGGRRASHATGLLEARQLLLAVAGNLDCVGTPLAEWARELGDLHATLMSASVSLACRPADFDDTATRTRIGDVIGMIDQWSMYHLPRTTTARCHTHTLGEVISHVADNYAQAQWRLRHSEGAEHRHMVAQRLAQVQQGYADLIEEIRMLRVEFPVGWYSNRPVS
ncbi:hypothetical protein [Nocardia salmonicida]|uniref:hypothetical protein n=1 Tax=Nocardia salmonicida TaxID=53431 RepID=UPI002E294975|nr:hypothetical protein [Nocardia salmonicida]